MKNFNSNSANESNNLSTISSADEKKKVSGSCNFNMSNSNNNKRMKKNSAFGTKSAFDKALDTFSEMMIEAIQNIQNDWRKPWFNNGGVSWARNINGREYNGMNALMLSFFCQKYGFTVPVFGTFGAKGRGKLLGFNVMAKRCRQKKKLQYIATFLLKYLVE